MVPPLDGNSRTLVEFILVAFSHLQRPFTHRTNRCIGLEIRAGLHTGEYKLIGDEAVGIAIHIGARVAAKAGANEVVVSRTVKDLVPDSEIRFRDHGVHKLKGGPDRWRLYLVDS